MNSNSKTFKLNFCSFPFHLQFIEASPIDYGGIEIEPVNDVVSIHSINEELQSLKRAARQVRINCFLSNFKQDCAFNFKCPFSGGGSGGIGGGSGGPGGGFSGPGGFNITELLNIARTVLGVLNQGGQDSNRLRNF